MLTALFTPSQTEGGILTAITEPTIDTFVPFFWLRDIPSRQTQQRKNGEQSRVRSGAYLVFPIQIMYFWFTAGEKQTLQQLRPVASN